MADRLSNAGTALVVDAEFETLARSAAPADGARMPRQGRMVPREMLPSRIGLLTKTDDGRTDRPMPLPVFALIATLSACAAFYLSGGHVLFARQQAVAALPAAMTPVQPADALALEDVSVRIDTGSGRAIFVIRAMIGNRSAGTLQVPPVTVTFGDPGGASVTHTVPRGETLAPGERMGFTTRIPAGDYSGMEPRLGFKAGI